MPAKKTSKNTAKKLPASTKKPLKRAVKNSQKSAATKWSEDGLRLRKLNRHQNKVKEKGFQRSISTPKARIILGRSLRQLFRNKKLFLGILLTYGILYLLFVKGISANFQLGNLRQNLDKTFSGKLSGLGSGIALYGLLLGSAGSTNNDAGGVYQTVLVIVISLALIWALRQTYSGTPKLRVRDSFYKGMSALIPFTIVLLVVLLQFLPALIAGSLYSTAQGNGLLVGPIQQILAIIILLAGLAWTFYMVSSSLFALYIVTLRDSTPWASIKAAKKLVRYRRLIILRKVVFLPVIMLVFSAVVLIPLIIFLAPAAEILFMLFTIALLAILHSYFYTLYRSLL